MTHRSERIPPHPHPPQPGIRRVLLACLAVTPLLAACPDGGLTTLGSDPVADVLEITAADTVLEEGSTSDYEARVLDTEGNPMDGVTIAWAANDESVATVGESTGTVAAQLAGVTYIVARTTDTDSQLADSVLLEVRLPAVEYNQAELRVTGAMTADYSFDADQGDNLGGWVLKSVKADSLSDAALYMANNEAFFMVGFPETSDVSPGTYELISWDLPAVLQLDDDPQFWVDGPISMLYDEATNTLWGNVGGGTITVDSVVGEAGYWSNDGSEPAMAKVWATVDLTAAGFEQDTTTYEWSPTGDTIAVTGQFAVGYAKDLIGSVSVTLSGDISASITDDWETARYDDGALEFGLYGEHGDAYLFMDIRIDSVALDSLGGAGTVDVDSAGDPDDLYFYDFDCNCFKDLSGTYLSTRSEEGEGEGVSESGTLTIDEYLAGSPPEGVIRGTGSAVLGLYRPSDYNDTTGEWGPPSGEVQAEIEFHVPVYGSDGSAMTARSPSTSVHPGSGSDPPVHPRKTVDLPWGPEK